MSEKTKTSVNMTERSNVVTSEPEVKIRFEELKEKRDAKETVEEDNMLCNVVNRESEEVKEEDSEVPEVLAAEDIVLAAEDQALVKEVQQVVAAEDQILVAEDIVLATEVQNAENSDQDLAAEDDGKIFSAEEVLATEAAVEVIAPEDSPEYKHVDVEETVPADTMQDLAREEVFFSNFFLWKLG